MAVFGGERLAAVGGDLSQVLLPTGERSRGLGEGKADYILPVLAEKNWGKWTTYGNVGYVVQTVEGEHNYWYEGVSINREITERLELGGEVSENSPPPVEGESNLTFNLGGTWKLSDQFNLLFSAGRSIHGDTDFMAYLGIQMDEIRHLLGLSLADQRDVDVLGNSNVGNDVAALRHV